MKSYEILILCGPLGRPPKLNGLAFLIRAIPREDIRNVGLDTKKSKELFHVEHCTVYSFVFLVLRFARLDTMQTKELVHVDHCTVYNFVFLFFVKMSVHSIAGLSKEASPQKEQFLPSSHSWDSWIGFWAKLYYISSSLGLWDIFGLCNHIHLGYHKRNNSIDSHILGRDG